MNMRNPTRLSDVFPHWMTYGGIFYNLGDSPWMEDIEDDTSLDLVYYGNHSGDKIISPLVNKLLIDGEIKQQSMSKIADVIRTMFYPKWTRLYAVTKLEYNPIENYRMTEDGTDVNDIDYDGQHTRTDNLSHGKTGTETQTLNLSDARTDNLSHGKTGTETQTLNLSDTRTDDLAESITSSKTNHPITSTTEDVYAFNSGLGVPSRNVSVTGNDTESLTSAKSNTGTQTNAKTGTDQTTHNTTETDTGTSTLLKTGTDQTRHDTTETDTGTSTLLKTGTDQTSYGTTETDTGTSTLLKTGTDQTSYGTTETDTGTSTTVVNDTRYEHLDHDLTRYGNIGVTTTQQMIEQEIALWQWNFFEDVVFPDVDRILTIQTY